MKKRIWELDALRGTCILGMVAVHFVYDLTELYALVKWDLPGAFTFIQNWGGVLFLLISGICVTLGRYHIRRGLIVFGGGMLCTAVTAGMYFFDLADKSIIIYFGILHCLGVCMLLWEPLKKLPVWAMTLLGLGLAAAGFWLQRMDPVDFSWLVPLGILSKGFSSSDYFPLLPNLGFFLLGSVIGKTVYHKKESLLPNLNSQNPVFSFLCGCGRHSLWIYLLHQPVLSGILYLILLVR